MLGSNSVWSLLLSTLVVVLLGGCISPSVADNEDTNLFGSGLPANGTSVFYIVCAVLGFILVCTVVAAAIWRSGILSNRYSMLHQRQNQPETDGIQLTTAAEHAEPSTSATTSTTKHAHVAAHQEPKAATSPAAANH